MTFRISPAGVASTVLLVILLAVGSRPAAAEIVLLHSGYPHEALYGIALEDDQAIAVGMPALILASPDRGRSWQVETIDNGSLALLGVSMSGKNAIAVGQMGKIFYRNPASIWTAADSGTTERLLSVALNARGVAVATGSFGTVLLSRDSGVTWTSIAPDWETLLRNGGEQPHVNAVDVSASGVITVAGEFGLVLRSSDEGESWQVLAQGDAALFGLCLDADGRGAAVGQNGTVLVSNGWNTPWREVETDHDENLLDVWVDGNGRMTVTGVRTLLIGRDWGANWTTIKRKDIATGWYQGVAANDEKVDAPLAVGYDARILRVGD